MPADRERLEGRLGAKVEGDLPYFVEVADYGREKGNIVQLQHPHFLTNFALPTPCPSEEKNI